jgi:hypothetical protein
MTRASWIASFAVAFVLVGCAMGQCAPSGKYLRTESFSTLRSVKDLPGPAGTELSLEEHRESILATLRDYEGSPEPLETKLRGTLKGCDVRLSGQNKRGRVEVSGTISIAIFKGTIVRQIGKDVYSEKVSLKRNPLRDNLESGL